MIKFFHHSIFGVSFLPALVVLPAVSDTVTNRQSITENTSYTNLVAENISSTSANNGGVFYMEDVQDVTLTFNGNTTFKNNSLTGSSSGMGGAIGNGWLSTKDASKWTPYTPGGKIIFNGRTLFEGNYVANKSGGGALFNYGVGTLESPDIVFNDTVTFKENKATSSSSSTVVGGGALHSQGGTIVFNKAVNFTKNESASKGGAILNSGHMVFEDISEFNNNTAGVSGGALAIISGDVVFKKAAYFSDNTAKNGSAISLEEANNKLTFNDTAVFTKNKGTAVLWSNGNSATISFKNGAIFDNNTNTANGSLQNSKASSLVEVTGGNLWFTNNTGSNGGAVTSSGTFTVATTDTVLFDNNRTTSSAGAFSNGGTVSMNAKKITFNNNKADSGYGGAVFNSGDFSILAKENIFTNNLASDVKTVKSGGGAIHNRGNTGTSTLVIGADNSINIFDSNVSKAHGGAIVARAVDGDAQNSEVFINGTTRFSNNKSKVNGGAIWNYVAEDIEITHTTGTATFTFNGDTSFINNVAEGLGGAIYNNSVMSFNGVTVFADNKSGDKLNDIYNDGRISFNNDATLNGGIDGEGELIIAENAKLNIGTSSIIQNSITLNGNMFVTLRPGDAQITAETFDGEGALNLTMAKAGTYHVFGDAVFDNFAWDRKGMIFDDFGENALYRLSWSADGKDVTASVKSVEEIITETSLADETAVAVSHVAEAASKSDSVPLQELSVKLQEKLAVGDTKAVEQATKAVHPETESVAQSVSSSVQNTVVNLASARMSTPTVGRNGGDVQWTSGGVWAQGLFNKSKQNDAFGGYTRGIAAGLDGTINKHWTIGAGYSFAHSDIDGTVRNTEIDSNTIFVYGQYKPTKWYMNAIANYTMSDYSERGTVIDNVVVTGDYGVDSFGGAMATGYDFSNGVTPELGLRYIHVMTSDYANSYGVKTHIDDSDFLTGIIGAKYAFNVIATKHLLFSPQLNAGLKYDLLSDKQVATVALPGIDSYTLDGQRLKRIGGEFGIGLGMRYHDLEMSVNYDIDVREDYTSQTGMLKFRYNF